MYHDAINRIYVFNVNCYNYNNFQKNYLNREIVYLNETVKAIGISYYNSFPGQTDVAYLTLVNRKNQTLISNYPVMDLMDNTSSASPGSFINKFFRLRCFNLKDISTSGSYVIYTDVSGPLSPNAIAMQINFYY